MSATPSDAIVCWLKVLYLSKTHFTSAVGEWMGWGVGRGNAMTNWKMSPRSLPFCGDRLSSLRHFWPHFKVGSKVREPRNWPPKLARSKISATTAWLFKTWSQICKIKTGCDMFQTSVYFHYTPPPPPPPQPHPKSGLDRNPSKPSLGSSTGGPASRCECVKW